MNRYQYIDVLTGEVLDPPARARPVYDDRPRHSGAELDRMKSRRAVKRRPYKRSQVAAHDAIAALVLYSAVVTGLLLASN